MFWIVIRSKKVYKGWEGWEKKKEGFPQGEMTSKTFKQKNKNKVLSPNSLKPDQNQYLTFLNSNSRLISHAVCKILVGKHYSIHSYIQLSTLLCRIGWKIVLQVRSHSIFGGWVLVYLVAAITMIVSVKPTRCCQKEKAGHNTNKQIRDLVDYTTSCTFLLILACVFSCFFSLS